MIMVSVVIPTYNHRNFIAQAIEGALMQKTDFPYEIIIGEDESNDGTREICIDYAELHPDKIRLFLRERKDVIYVNGSPTAKFNYIECFKAASGKYIALCEGDDYWGDPNKLQKQVDFLESHPEYVICHHDEMEIDEDDNVIAYSRIHEDTKQDFSRDELVKDTLVLTSTACFQNVEILQNMPDEFYRASNGDFFIFSLLGLYGKSWYMGKEVKPTRYRVHPGGVWSMQDEWKKRFRQSGTQYWISRYYRKKGMKKYEENFQYKYLSSCLKLVRHLVRGNLPKFSVLRQYMLSNPRKYLDIKFVYGFMKVFVIRIRSFVVGKFTSGTKGYRPDAAHINSK